MREEKISGRQYGVLVFVIMMSPLIHAIPVRIATAGKAAWLLVIPSVIPLAVLFYFLFRTLGRMPEGSGLRDVYLTALGNRWGKLCCWINVAWLLMLTVMNFRFSAERYISAVYPETDLAIFNLVLVLLLLLIVWNDFGDLVRMGKILFWVIAITLIAVLVMAANQIQLYNIWPVTDIKWKEAGMGTLRMSTVMAFAVPTSFLVGRVNWKSNKKGIVWWLTILTVTMLAIGVAVIGVFGPGLSERLEVPFFTLDKQITFQGKVKGLETVVAAMWLMSDTAITGVHVFAAGEAMKCTIPNKRLAVARVLLVCTILPLCSLLPASTFQVDAYYRSVGMPANIIIGFVMPAVALAIGRIRRKW